MEPAFSLVTFFNPQQMASWRGHTGCRISLHRPQPHCPKQGSQTHTVTHQMLELVHYKIIIKWTLFLFVTLGGRVKTLKIKDKAPKQKKKPKNSTSGCRHLVVIVLEFLLPACCQYLPAHLLSSWFLLWCHPLMPRSPPLLWSRHDAYPILPIMHYFVCFSPLEDKHLFYLRFLTPSTKHSINIY